LFQDAILVTQALGCRYLWIDSLCIIQNDKKDWIEHSKSMADIYSNGYFNIAATAAKDSSASLFQERQQFVRVAHGGGVEHGPIDTHTIETAVATSAPVHVRRPHTPTHQCVVGEGLEEKYLVEPLLDRAWVFQEKLLSRRAVFFSKSELLWQCQECADSVGHVRCECGDMDNCSAIYPQMIDADGESRMPGSMIFLLANQVYGSTQGRFAKITTGQRSVQEARRMWLRFVSQYSSLALTRESDRPYAVAGIARRVQEVTGDTYLAGLWLEDLPSGLLWAPQPMLSKTARRRPGIPSWSWMSREELSQGGSPLVMYLCISGDFRADPRLRVVAEETFCLTEADDDFGSVFGGQIRLKAAVQRCVVVQEAGQAPGTPSMVRLDGRDEDDDEIAMLDCSFDKTEPVRPGDVLDCVLIGAGTTVLGAGEHSLLLRAVDGRKGVYRRVGIVPLLPLFSFAKARVATFTII
jgi:hypothetical protein